MPIDTTVDHSSRRIVASAEGSFRADELVAFLEYMRSSGTWSYGVLFDMRLVTGQPGTSELRAIAQMTREPAGGNESRGPVAVVAANPVIYGMACAYAAMSAPGRVEVFSDREEAENWLATRMSAQRRDA